MSEQSNILATIQRGPTEQLQISISEFKGKKYFNLRIYYTTDDGENWIPTKKGVTFSPEQLQTLKEAVETGMSELGVTPEA